MASMTIRSTYALDRDTVDRLDSLARQWNVSKSEALRRAIRAADRLSAVDDRVGALDALQSSVKMTRRTASTWSARVRRERADADASTSRAR